MESAEYEESVLDYLARYAPLVDRGVPAEADAVGPARAVGPGDVREALERCQAALGLESTGVVDDETRAAMSRKRCGIRDPAAVTASVQGLWPQRSLGFGFGDLNSGPVSPDSVRDGVSAALRTWEDVGAGFSFYEVDSEATADIWFEWRPTDDADYDMAGVTIAHADFPPFPPEAAEIVDRPPLPLHLEVGEGWITGADPAGYDLETVVLHELGHCLGFEHTPLVASVMYPSFRRNWIRRELHVTDRDNLRALYSA